MADQILHMLIFFILFVNNLSFWLKNIAHLESHHLAEHNEAGHAPLDPPRRVSMKFLSLSRFCNRINSFLEKMFGKPAPEGVIRVVTIPPLRLFFYKNRQTKPLPHFRKAKKAIHSFDTPSEGALGSSSQRVEPPRGRTTGGERDHTTIPHA